MDINEKYTVKKYMNIVNAFRTVASHATRRDEILKNKRILKKYKSLSEENLKYSKLAKLSPYLDIPDSVKIQSDYAESIFSKRKYNEVYATYFDKMAIDYNDERYKTIAQNIRACAADWFFSEYSMQSTRILNSIFLCKNKFCSNCQHLRQGVHLKRFGAAFEKLSKTNDLYHVTLTVPNVSGLMLNTTINAIMKNFLKLIRYFSLDAKISGVDFEKFGYIGAVRCLECTIKSSEYHPHLHCIFVLKKNLKLPAIYSNAYSFNYGAFENKFSELEILIQKVWYLINNNIRVNAISISGLSIGYSCIADKVVGNDYAEVFKYITKLTKQDNTDNLMTYEQFITLYFSLFSRRQIQAYGCLYGISTDDSLNLTREDILKLIVAKLKIVEDPVFVSSKIDDVIKSLKDKHYTIISKHSLEKFLDFNK